MIDLEAGIDPISQHGMPYERISITHAERRRPARNLYEEKHSEMFLLQIVIVVQAKQHQKNRSCTAPFCKSSYKSITDCVGDERESFSLRDVIYSVAAYMTCYPSFVFIEL